MSRHAGMLACEHASSKFYTHFSTFAYGGTCVPSRVHSCSKVSRHSCLHFRMWGQEGDARAASRRRGGSTQVPVLWFSSSALHIEDLRLSEARVAAKWSWPIFCNRLWHHQTSVHESMRSCMLDGQRVR